MSWKIDLNHSKIEFIARHLRITHVRGSMDRFSGVIEFDPDNPVASSVRAEIDPASINTHFSPRDANLRSRVLLNVKKYPRISYQSKRIEVIDGNHGRIVGDLTIHDVPREITLDVEYHGLGKTAEGYTSAGFSATTRINRKDWDLHWGALLETGGILVGDDLDVKIEVYAVLQVQPVSVDAMHMQMDRVSGD